jgi:hypothetical protein
MKNATGFDEYAFAPTLLRPSQSQRAARASHSAAARSMRAALAALASSAIGHLGDQIAGGGSDGGIQRTSQGIATLLRAWQRGCLQTCGAGHTLRYGRQHLIKIAR